MKPELPLNTYMTTLLVVEYYTSSYLALFMRYYQLQRNLYLKKLF